MTQWGKNDNAANSVLWASAGLNAPADANTRNRLYQNTTVGAFETNEINGQFGLDAAEKVTSGNAAAQHAGWVLKTTGTGGVKTITLVSGGSGINAAGYLSITGGGGSGANASYAIANSQNTLQSYSTNPAWNVVTSVTLHNPGTGYTGAANIVYVGANTTRPVISLTMGDRVGRVQMETLVAMGSIV
jgi:hypothetical protein